MELQEALEEILRLKEELKNANDSIEQMTTEKEKNIKSIEEQKTEITRLKEKNFEFFEKLSQQYENDKTVNTTLTNGQEPQQNDIKSLDAIVNEMI